MSANFFETELPWGQRNRSQSNKQSLFTSIHFYLTNFWHCQEELKILKTFWSLILIWLSETVYIGLTKHFPQTSKTFQSFNFSLPKWLKLHQRLFYSKLSKKQKFLSQYKLFQISFRSEIDSEKNKEKMYHADGY